MPIKKPAAKKPAAKKPAAKKPATRVASVKKPAVKKPASAKKAASVRPAAKERRRHDEVALAFAKALVKRDFVLAHGFLAPPLKKKLTPRSLSDELAALSEGYAEGPPTLASLDEAFSLDTWPGRQPTDLGWSYVSIEGDDFVEAVSVIVCDVSGAALIRAIEWGRP